MRPDLRGWRHRRHSRARAPGLELRRGDCRHRATGARAAGPRSSCSCPRASTCTRSCRAFDLAASLGCDAFVTGPMMRIGRAAAAWSDIAVQRFRVAARRRRPSRAFRSRATTGSDLSIYPWDIVTEMETRLESPQAMLLVVPERQGQALERAALLAGGFAARLARDGVARLSRRVAQRRSAGVRRPLPVGARLLLRHARRDVADAVPRVDASRNQFGST